MNPNQLEFRTAENLTLRADEWNQSGSPTALLLHGGGQTRHSWTATAIKLAQEGLRVITLDTRGHGESDWDPAGRYSPDVLTDDVLAVIDRIGGPLILVGASMGGLTGIDAAWQSGPAVTTKLILVDSVPRYERSGGERIKAFMTGNPDGFASLDEAADAVSKYLPHRGRPSDPTGLERNLRRREDGRWYWHWDPAFLDQPSDTVLSTANELETKAAALDIPILLIRGKMSDVVSDTAAQSFLDVVPGALFVELPRAAHTAAGDDNDAFLSAVLSFVLE